MLAIFRGKNMPPCGMSIDLYFPTSELIVCSYSGTEQNLQIIVYCISEFVVMKQAFVILCGGSKVQLRES